MDEFGTVSHSDSDPVPDQLHALFNNPDDVRVQKLPRAGLRAIEVMRHGSVCLLLAVPVQAPSSGP